MEYSIMKKSDYDVDELDSYVDEEDLWLRMKQLVEEYIEEEGDEPKIVSQDEKNRVIIVDNDGTQVTFYARGEHETGDYALQRLASGDKMTLEEVNKWRKILRDDQDARWRSSQC